MQVKRYSEIGLERVYNPEFAKRTGRTDVVFWDIFPVMNEEVLTLTFESINSDKPQGVWLRTNKGMVINGMRCSSATLWYDTAPREVPIQCYTSNGFLSLYNTYRDGDRRVSQAASMGMLVEELPNGCRYRCNDIGFDTVFDKLIFRIERVG